MFKIEDILNSKENESPTPIKTIVREHKENILCPRNPKFNPSTKVDPKDQNDYNNISPYPFAKFGLAKFTDINKTIFYTLEDGTVGKLDVSTEQILCENKIHKDIIFDFDLSPMHEILLTASKDHSAAVLSGKNLETIKIYEPKNPVRNLNSCHISPLFGSKNSEEDGRFHCVVAGGQEARNVTTTTSREGGFEILIYNLMYGEEIGAIHAHFGPVNTVRFSPNGKMLASGSEDASVKIHKMEDDYYHYWSHQLTLIN